MITPPYTVKSFQSLKPGDVFRGNLSLGSGDAAIRLAIKAHLGDENGEPAAVLLTDTPRKQPTYLGPANFDTDVLTLNADVQFEVSPMSEILFGHAASQREPNALLLEDGRWLLPAEAPSGSFTDRAYLDLKTGILRFAAPKSRRAVFTKWQLRLSDTQEVLYSAP